MRCLEKGGAPRLSRGVRDPLPCDSVRKNEVGNQGKRSTREKADCA